MSLERIWQKENAKRIATQLVKDRCNRNWPIHAEIALAVFQRFSDEAAKDGVNLMVSPADPDANLKTLGVSYWGQSSVVLTFGIEHTGTGKITRNADGSEEIEHYYEQGASLVINHSPAEGVIQIFLDPPSTKQAAVKKNVILLDFTYNPDYLAPWRVERLISKFLVFNRVESCLQHRGWLDTFKVRWWRFWDIRNRRGFLEKLQHLLTPWELVLITAISAIVLAKL